MTSTIAMDGLTIRDATQDDVKFILSSWFHSAKESQCNHEAFDKHELNREIFLRLARCKALVLSHKDVPDFILAWIAIDNNKQVQWCYTRHVLRRLGVQRFLRAIVLADGVDSCTSTPVVQVRRGSRQFAKRYWRYADDR